jgi:hypothetical protein
MNKILLSIFLVLICIASPVLYGQTNPSQVSVTLAPGVVYRDTIQSNFDPAGPFVNPEDAIYVEKLSIGAQKYAIEISLKDPYTYRGSASVTFQYTTTGFPPQPRWIQYNVNCISSVITTHADFVYHNGQVEVTVFPLANDVTTGDSLVLNNVSQVVNGSALAAGDSIVFTPSDTLDAIIIYTASDNAESKKQGKIYVKYATEETVLTDTLRFTLLNTQQQTILLPYSGFTPDGNPQKGHVEVAGEYGALYTPNKSVTGSDIFTFSHDNGSEIRVEILLKSLPQQTSSVRDDVVYTAKNRPVSFNVFDNDLSRNFPINLYSTGLVYSGNGNFSYTPPTGFTGVKQFFYRVNYGTYTSTGKIFVNIGNVSPKQDIEYTFNTSKNVPVAVQYDVPIDGYSFSQVVQPNFGTVTYFEDGEELEWSCNTLSSKAMFVYIPDQNYYGTDEFQVNYCIDGAQCIIYKIHLTIHDRPSDTLCHCIGKNCVWPGDFDNDGVVTTKDLLPLGRYLGMSGRPRNDIDYGYWHGQQKENWGLIQTTGADLAYIDANGDGVLNTEDQEVLENHFQKTHNLIPEPVLSIKDYPFYLIPNQTELDSGDLLVLTLSIGNEYFPVLDLHGLAFGLNINPEIMDSSSFAGHFYKNGWFTYASPSLQMMAHPETGNIFAGFTRSGGSGVSGSGPVGQISFIVIDEIDGWKGDGTNTPIISRIWLNNIITEDENGDRAQVADSYVDITINKNKSQPVPTEDKLLVFPNPVADQVNLHFNGRNTIYSYSMTDMFGQIIVQKDQHNQQSASIDTATLPNGMYALQVTTSLGVITKKVMVQK